MRNPGDMNRIHFQLAMVAYNLNAWLMMFNREPVADATKLKHTTLAIARLRFLFIAAKIWSWSHRHSLQRSIPGAGTVSKTDDPAALDQVAGPRIPSSSASCVKITKVRCCGARRVDRGVCIEFYAQPATATERAASTARARWKYCGGGLPRSIRATAPS